MDALVLLLLEIVPAQKTQHEPELGEAIFGSVTPGFADDLVQHTGNVGRILKAQILAEGHRRAFSDRGGEFGMPDEKLLQLDVAIIQQHRDGRDCEVQRMESWFEIKEAVAARDLKQPVAQV